MINWITEKPHGDHAPALKGTALGELLLVKIYWKNYDGFFKGYVFGQNGSETVPGEFETLTQAKAAAETYVTELITSAANPGLPESYAAQKAIFSNFLGYLDRAGIFVCGKAYDNKIIKADESRVEYLIENFVINGEWRKNE